ncbi:MAG: succinyldiaminopimelate transaminase [Acidimicrobiia bacterium]|nr:succinyldiaminopimelate transaminase [Acidimicrobiia bacterium]MYC44532.1 succinyldiaminopimelate transaminase [Acidimicrobiia bacterium]MYI20074.1 succinyldiaminopimelate transaminase [Acidimicrobiia bacterium]
MSAPTALEPYPYDRLGDLRGTADRHAGGCVDLSIGDPCDPPPPAAVEALGGSGAERSYPSSIGTPAFRAAAAGWLERRFGVEVASGGVMACVGTKELVASLPRLLQLRGHRGDTVLYPAVAYPTYAMGARLAGLRAVPVPLEGRGRLDLGSVDPADVERSLCLWVNSPANPTGAVDDLGAIAAWGRERGVLVCSDECYVEFVWERTRPAGAGPPLEGRTMLSTGLEGVLALHSLSKRSNLAGLRAGFYTGDTDLVDFLAQARRHLGFMVPGPVQAAAAVALDDDDHVEAQRQRYRDRLALLSRLLEGLGLRAPLPEGAFYLWVPAPDGDAWALAERLAVTAGMLVSPGEFYGGAGADHVRVSATVTDERLALLADRLAAAGTPDGPR